MRITIELWSRVEKGSSTPHWTAGARLAGTDVVFKEYASGVVPPGKAFPLKAMLSIMREARDVLSNEQGLERIYELVEIGPDHAVFVESTSRSKTENILLDLLSGLKSERSRGISE